MNDLMDAKEVTNLLRISTSTLERWVRAGKLPQPIRLGHRRLWTAESVQGVIDQAASEVAE